MTRAVLVCAVLAATSTALSTRSATDASASRTSTRVVDRTFRCSVLQRAGARFLEASAVSGAREPAGEARWLHVAGAELGDRDGAVVSAAAGAPWDAAGARPAPPQREGIYRQSGRAGLFVERACTPR